MKLKLDKILKNKIVLYLTFFLSLVTIFGYLVKQNYQAILFFTLVLFLTKHFSNNMIVILGVSIIATNLLDLFRVFSSSHLEGMENKEKQPSKQVIEVLNHISNEYFNDKVDLNELSNKNLSKENAKKLKQINKNDVEKEIKNIETNIYKLSYSDITYLTDLANYWKSYFKLAMDGNDNQKENEMFNLYIKIINNGIELLNKALEKKLTDENKEESVKNLESDFNLCADNEKYDNKSKKCIPKCANEEKYDEKTQKCIANSSSKDSTSKKETMATLNPANLGDVNNPGSGNLNNFNDAKMKEMAFDNLDKIFGSDGMRSLSSDANSLNEKQNAIMGQLKDIGPLISQAMNLIKNVDMDAINNVSSKMTGMITNLQDLKSKQ
uniref:Uncharacterized protein n=1 Tax=Nucleocytoviricota sp. TaxID=2809609 RepID=A0A9E8G3W1_9VIRU|nr:hypothetical protein [Nucleocytoviricota sp.]UZT29338.1 hypothetical protein [Nucleocytoviricota sp.]